MMFLQPPAGIEWLASWVPLKDGGEALVNELQKELPSNHVLFGVPVTAIARRTDCDDVLFLAGDSLKPLAVVHLTFSGKVEHDQQWPWTTLYKDWQDWLERCLIPDHNEYSDGSAEADDAGK